MHRQLDAIADDLQAAERRLRILEATLSPQVWRRRPEANAWSPLECVAHLNLTSQAVLPLVTAGLREADATGTPGGIVYRRDAVGWCVWKVLAPVAGVKMRTASAFVPSGRSSINAVIADFQRLQEELLSCVHRADGLPIDRITVVSPFDRRVKYNLYAALTLVPRHQHRHLTQAERTVRATTPGMLSPRRRLEARRAFVRSVSPAR